ncbi:MAG: VOC family protein [Thermoanaerobaculia bacterium]
MRLPRLRLAPIFQIPLLLLLAATPVAGANDPAAPPLFFALSVPDLEASIRWYTEKLDLEATRLPANASARVALLQGEGLLVELVEHSAAFDLAARVPEATGRYLVHGPFKVGFFVHDLDAAVARLRSRGAMFQGSVFTDDVLRAKSILVLDNDGNVLQLFERLPAK